MAPTFCLLIGTSLSAGLRIQWASCPSGGHLPFHSFRRMAHVSFLCFDFEPEAAKNLSSSNVAVSDSLRPVPPLPLTSSESRDAVILTEPATATKSLCLAAVGHPDGFGQELPTVARLRSPSLGRPRKKKQTVASKRAGSNEIEDDHFLFGTRCSGKHA